MIVSVFFWYMKKYKGLSTIGMKRNLPKMTSAKLHYDPWSWQFVTYLIKLLLGSLSNALHMASFNNPSSSEQFVNLM